MESNKKTSKEYLGRLTKQTLDLYVEGDTDSLEKSLKSENPNFDILNKNDVILFQGDSITDCDRDRLSGKANDERALGNGYPYFITNYLLDAVPDKNLKIYNRAVGGDKVFQLADRWEKDTLQIKPDVLSILVGVNDYWHTITKNYAGALETYEQDYRQLLKKTLDRLPNLTLVLGEPFASKGGSATNKETGWDWDFEAFRNYRRAALQIARDFNAVFIPYQSIFNEALKIKPIDYWSKDGVHPTIEGSKLMAIGWLQAVRMSFE